MDRIIAEKKSTGAARKLYNWRGYAVGNLKLKDKDEPVPILIPMTDAKRLMDKKDKKEELVLSLCGEDVEVNVSKILWNPEESVVDEIDFAQ